MTNRKKNKRRNPFKRMFIFQNLLVFQITNNLYTTLKNIKFAEKKMRNKK